MGGGKWWCEEVELVGIGARRGFCWELEGFFISVFFFFFFIRSQFFTKKISVFFFYYSRKWYFAVGGWWTDNRTRVARDREKHFFLIGINSGRLLCLSGKIVFGAGVPEYYKYLYIFWVYLVNFNELDLIIIIIWSLKNKFKTYCKF